MKSSRSPTTWHTGLPPERVQAAYQAEIARCDRHLVEAMTEPERFIWAVQRRAAMRLAAQAAAQAAA
ncbi:hypothetical protein [Methylibium petroleiphilum]|uniref:hypothetical protein n=1 Tax=Methylibium petroleiphilum TaxID=105560 RepID=UPI003D2D0F52